MTKGITPNASSRQQEFADHVEKVARTSDKAAFTHLFGFYAPRVKAYLMGTNCPEALAEEITQDVMSTLWHKAHLFDRTKSSVSTWLFRIARNRRIDLIRRDKSDRLDPNDPTLFPTTSFIDEDGADALERDRRVRAAIEELPEEQALLIRMSFFESRPHAEISAALDLPLGTVKSRIRLAFNRLRKNLSEDEKIDV